MTLRASMRKHSFISSYRRSLLTAHALLLMTLAPVPVWAVTQQATAGEAQSTPSVAELLRRVDPAVVVLYTIERETALDQPGGEMSTSGLGSGFLVGDDGNVITAAHVVQTADQVVAEFLDGTRIPAVVIASDPLADLALLRLETIPTGVQPVALGDSDRTVLGEQVFVVGAPYGLGHTVTVGHVSGRRIQVDQGLGIEVEFFLTDTSINPGNSGGPMFNMQGEVIGIISSILTQSGGFEGLGFAVTSNEARDVLFGSRMMWSGLTGILLEGDVAGAFNIPQEFGYLIQKVADNSPARTIGLRAGVLPVTIGDRTLLIGGDVILGVNRIELTRRSFAQIRQQLAELRVGEGFTLQILRAGRRVDLVGIR